MSKFHEINLTPRQVDLLALALDTTINNSPMAPSLKAELEGLFEFFDELSEETPIPNKQVKIHLVLNRDSNIIPFVPKG